VLAADVDTSILPVVVVYQRGAAAKFFDGPHSAEALVSYAAKLQAPPVAELRSVQDVADFFGLPSEHLRRNNAQPARACPATRIREIRRRRARPCGARRAARGAGRRRGRIGGGSGAAAARVVGRCRLLLRRSWRASPTSSPGDASEAPRRHRRRSTTRSGPSSRTLL
jgi:hypothetical protein